VREWLRLLSQHGVEADGYAQAMRNESPLLSWPKRALNTLKRERGQYDFSNEVHEAMQGCLACKSCVGQCPIKVNVPDFRARFLELYYTRYLRPVKDYMVASLEFMMPTLAKFPAPYNWAMTNSVVKGLTARFAGLVDSPTICKLGLKQEMDARGVPVASAATLSALSEEQRAKTVVIVQDAFTSYFETQLVLDIADLLKRLGFNVQLAPFAPNGKPLHVHGFIKRFTKVAQQNVEMLRQFEAQGVALVGVDPSMTLTYRQEYAQVVSGELPKVQLLQEWLSQQRDALSKIKLEGRANYRLMSHCTEKTNAAPSVKQWQTIFADLGLDLSVVATGCCGMAGTFGHESANQAASKEIYSQSWQPIVNSAAVDDEFLATGYSCRSQVKRLDQKQLKHPAQALLELMR
jgi:Fe-S oxidoreductase